MARLIEKLRQLARLMGKARTSGQIEDRGKLPPVGDVLSEGTVMKLMQMIEQTREKEYSCEEAFALLDEYVELALSKKEAAALMPLVKKHIDLCADCQDEYETLLRLLQSDTSTPAA